MSFSVAVARVKGVGKTSIAINVALSLAKMDIAPVCWTLILVSPMPIFARHRPETEYERHVHNQASLLDLCTPAPFGLKFISGGSGMVDILNLDSASRFQIVGSTEALAQST